MIVAVSMFRNEEDVAEPVIRHLLAEGVDLVIVADNLSTDRTRPILDALADSLPVEVLDDFEPAYYQANKMTGLSQLACERGATWVLPFDADEVWYSPDGLIGDVLPDCGVDVIYAHGWDHLPDGERYDNPFLGLTGRRTHHQTFPKVVYRATPAAQLRQGNHEVDHPGFVSVVGRLLEYRHFQWRSFDQFTAKVRNGRAAYEATTLPDTEGAHWRTLGALSHDDLETEWHRLCDQTGLVHDPAPIR